LSEPLLLTKFFNPPAPPNDLHRARLFALMDELLTQGKRLGLICAPAGYGKTTLVSDWLRQAGQHASAIRYAWLSLEDADNDPQQFFTYFSASLARSLAGSTAEGDIAQRIPQSAAPQAIMAAWSNELTQLAGPLVLVLDDYHAVRTTAIHEALAYFLEHCPPDVHLAVTTRSNPPFPLARYRARGQLVEIRQDQLGFTPDEVRTLLEREPARNLGEPELAILTERIEGWPAGIQMALLSLKGKADPAQFIHSFSGSQGYILDYLAEEVLRSQPAILQEFMVNTALLHRFCAGLCDALYPDLPEKGISSEEIIAGLKAANLFLIPLDESGTWYRFHHLFNDLLRLRFKPAQRSDPGLATRIYQRAAGWFEAQGLHREAIQYALSAGDFDHAADLVERHTFSLFSEGELHALVSWIGLLPPELSSQRPWLGIYQAWALAFAGNIGEAARLCQTVEDLLPAGEAGTPQQMAMRFEMNAVRGIIHIMSGNIRAVLALESFASVAGASDHLFAQSAIHWALGYAWRMQGKIPQAIGAFREMQQFGERSNNTWTLATAAGDLGNMLRLSGRLPEAEQVYREGLRRVQASGSAGAGFVGRIESFLATILYEKDELGEAQRLAARSVQHNRYWANPNHVAHGHWALAHVSFALGEQAEAEANLSQAEAFARDPSVVPPLKALIAAERVRFWLKQGRLDAAAGWLEEQQALLRADQAANPEQADVVRLTAARVLLASGQAARAAEILEPIIAAARLGGRINTLIEALVLLAVARSDKSAVLEALQLGFIQGYRRVFLDEGQPMQTLLRSMALAGPATSREEHVKANLRAALEILIRPGQQQQPPTKPAPAASPLTGRELEILKGIAAGLSNPEIGKQLYISAGTVKAHTAAIYRKLDVANRAEAIAKGKDMGLL
jgi:LuxR family transcriptional regulator, maltose regulon positive regulatory protein